MLLINAYCFDVQEVRMKSIRVHNNKKVFVFFVDDYTAQYDILKRDPPKGKK